MLSNSLVFSKHFKDVINLIIEPDFTFFICEQSLHSTCPNTSCDFPALAEFFWTYSASLKTYFLNINK